MVLLIWIGVGFRFWYEKEPPLKQTIETHTATKAKVVSLAEPVPFVLSPPYRDPFLSISKHPGGSDRPKSPKHHAEAPVPPALKYLGSVHSVKQAVGLLRWESGEVSSVQAGLQLKALTILKVEPERLVFLYRHKTYQLKRLGS